ncbi:MAG: 2-hydroxyacyl-CoA dehydratase [Firmicutes bacterium]|nr:2-hydroxyacyl-CoA dehydratase [Bacillota bacterium]
MTQKGKPINDGLFNRTYDMFQLLKKLPDRFLSEEEVKGLLGVLPPDSANSLQSFFRPSIQRASRAFINMVAAVFDETRHAQKEGKKVVLLPFNFPPEIVHSFENLAPVTTELLSTAATIVLEGQGERYWDYVLGLGLPDHICSANAIELGSMLSGLDYEPDAIISGCVGSCDVNAKAHEFVSLLLDLPQIPLEKPTMDFDQGFKYFRKSYYKMIQKLEELAGEELKEENLREVSVRANRCTELYNDLWELKKHVPNPVPGIFSLLICGTRFAMWGREEGIRTLEQCVEVSRHNLESEAYRSREEIARIVWVYLSYFYDFVNFYDWMEDKGISNFGDALQLAFPQTIDLTSKESMLDDMIEMAWNNVMTRQMGASSMARGWSEDIIYVVKEWDLDGCVYCGHHSCKQTWSAFTVARNEVLKRTGVPTLGLQGDTWIRSMTPIGVIQEELEQFVNNVIAGKRGRGRGRRRRRAAR